MPAPPELGRIPGQIGLFEVQRQLEAEQQREPARHVAIAREVEVDLEREAVDGDEREKLQLEIGELEKKLLEELEESLEDILPDAFAVVKDACRRLQGTEHLYR